MTSHTATHSLEQNTPRRRSRQEVLPLRGAEDGASMRRSRIGEGEGGNQHREQAAAADPNRYQEYNFDDSRMRSAAEADQQRVRRVVQNVFESCHFECSNAPGLKVFK